MSTTPRRLLWALVGAAVLALAAVTFLFPRWLNTPAIRERVVAEVSRALGVDVQVADIRLTLFPPRLVLAEPSVTTPSGVAVEAEALTAVLHPFPLVRGEISLSSLRLVAPRITLDAAGTNTLGPSPSGDVLSPLVKAIEVATTAVSTPGTVISVAKGEVFVKAANHPLLHLWDVDARVEVQGQRSLVELTCQGEGVERVAFKGSVEPTSLAGTGRLTAAGLTPTTLLAGQLPEGVDLQGTKGDLALSWEAEDGQHVRAQWELSLDPLAVGLPAGRHRDKAALQGTLRWTPKSLGVAVSHLRLETLGLQGSAEMKWSRLDPRVRGSLLCPRLEVGPFRDLMLQHWGQRRWVRTLFEILRDGEVTNLELAASAPALSSLARLENLELRGTLQGGVVHAPAAELDVMDVHAEARISEGTLKVAALTGLSGESRAEGGTLTLGLRGPDAPLHLALDLDADLAVLPEVLRRTVRHQGFLDHLASVEGLRGRAHGTLIVGERLGDLHVSADVREVAGSGRYAGFPLVLDLSSGRLFLRPGRLEGKDLAGQIGKSPFAGAAGTMEWHGKPRIELTSAQGRADLGELFSWVAAIFPTLGVDGISEVQGTASVESLSVLGPLAAPEDWDVRLRAKLSESSAVIPGLGRFEVPSAEVAVSQGELRFSRAEAQFSDAELALEGSWQYQSQGRPVQSHVHGELGIAASRDLQNLLDLPEALRLKGPIRVRDGTFQWDGVRKGGFAGTLAAGPVELQLRVRDGPHSFSIPKATLRDETSDTEVAFSASRENDELTVALDGRLASAALEQLLVHTGFLSGVLSGTARVQLPVANPATATGEGYLEITGLELPGTHAVAVEQASVEIMGSEVRLEPARVRLGQSSVTLRGTATRTASGWNLDLDGTSPSLSADDIRLLTARMSSQGVKRPEIRTWFGPWTGTVRFSVDSFHYAPFTWSPLQGHVELGPSGSEAEITRGDLCGIETPGLLSSSGGQVRLGGKLDAQGLLLTATLACLWDVQDLITGTASLKADVNAASEPDHLLAASRGTFEVAANSGRIYRYDLLGRVFALLNVTELFRGRLPDLTGEGLGYESITTRGELRGGVLEFQEGVLDGASLTVFWHGTWDLNQDVLDLTLVVAPFKTADAVVRRLPIIGYVLGDSLVGVPVRVTGPRADPQIVPLDPGAVGSGLLGVVKRTLKLPLHLIQPLLGERPP